MSFFGRRAEGSAAASPPLPPPPPSAQYDSSSSPSPSSSSPSPAASGRSAAVLLATQELKGMTNLFNRLSESCFDKCVVKLSPSNPELAVGELACDDRCAIKYMEAQTIISEVLRKANQQQMQQMQQQQ